MYRRACDDPQPADHLTNDAAEQIADLVTNLDETRATPDNGIEVHL